MACKDIDDLEVLQAYADCWAARLATDAAKREWIWPEKLLESRTGQAPKVCWRAMERCDRRGYLEWGVSLRGGWLTDKGARYLDDNRKWVKGGPRMVRDAAGGLVLVGSEAPLNAEVSGCLRAPMPEDAPRTAAGSPLDRPVGPVAGA